MKVQDLLTHNVPLANLNSWRVGGVAEQLLQPESISHLQNFFQTQCPVKPITWLGLGSNVLIRSGGIKGLVILTTHLTAIHKVNSYNLQIEAGTPCAKVAKFAAKQGMAGGEFLVGIPGTIGGALAMNAGAFGREIWPLVEEVTTLDINGKLRNKAPQDFEIGYRYCHGLAKQEWFVSCKLRFQQGDPTALWETSKALLQQRKKTQPVGLPSCGSVFQNPKGEYAANLIERCGLKGHSIGNTTISDKHANFIVHDGEGTAEEIEALIQLIKQTVFDTHGIKLFCEVKILGEKLPS